MNHEEPEVEASWCKERRIEVIRYLRTEGLQHGEVGEWPAWHLAPYVSLWAIESKTSPGSVGWWVLCGDLPTDYVSATHASDPRLAMKAIAERWSRWIDGQARGETVDDFDLGSADESPALAGLLAPRARMLMEWAQDSSLW